MKKLMLHKGFTLIEFVVIISIFAIMAGVALVNFSGFRSNVGLNNLAHDIALTIRQAQVFGWSTKTQNGVLDSNGQTIGTSLQLDQTGNPVRFADGVYFKYDTSGFARQFVLYSKNDSTTGNEFYLENLDNPIDTITIQGPNHISAIHYAGTKDDLALPVDRSIPQGGGALAQSFSVAFSRPHPEAMFFSDGTALTDPAYNYIGIYISADSDCPNNAACSLADHVITISRFGEIAVQ